MSDSPTLSSEPAADPSLSAASIPLATNVVPVEILRRSQRAGAENEGMEIRWSNNQTSFYPANLLRRACPCAGCEELRGQGVHEKPLSGKPSGGKSSLLRVVKATLDESLALEQIWPIGNYAIGLRWGDGHDTGIYSYTLLQKLANTPQPEAA